MITVRAETIGAPEVAARVEALKPGILAGVKGALDTWSEELANYIKEDKLSGNPIRAHTGALRDSVNPIVESSGDVISGGAGAGAGLDYAKPLEFGSRPHEILPRTAKFLRFEVDGRIVYARKVNHPGNPAFRYMRGSFEEKSESGIEAIRAAVAEAMTA